VPPLQPVLLQPRRRRRRPLRGVDLRLRRLKPPHAQQALHRRRRDGGGGRAATSPTSTSCARTDANFIDLDAVRHGRGRALDVGDLRPLLEQRGRLSRSRPSASRSATRQRARRRSTPRSQRSRRRQPIELPSTDLLGYGPLAEEFDSGQLGLEWGIARAFADPPEKLLAMTPKVAFEMSVTNDVMMQVWQAKDDLVLTSPYMIPGELGMQSFNNLHKDKVKVTVITNSLAATDEPLVTTATRATAPACCRPASTSTS
jgi:phosphatidylserine/phosphatidylglycerophosphate/cardiolipin synthase-like enzyme